LLALTEQDMAEILGSTQQADKMVSGISGKAVELIQTRLDMQTFIYMSNMAKAVRRCGEIWLSMSKDIYVEEKRKMKTVGAMEEVGSIELMKPQIDEETGELIYENNLGDALFDVAVDVGPSSSSRRDATVRALTGMMQVTTDPTTQQVLQSMAIMNMEGEGIADIKEYFRKQLVQMGVMQPNEEEQQQMEAAQQNQQPDPQAMYLMAEAQKSEALARKADADTELTMANAEKTKADTLSILSEIDNPGTPQDESLVAMERRKKEVELGILQVQLEEKLRALQTPVQPVQPEPPKEEPQNLEVEAAMAIADAVEGLTENVKEVKSVVENMTLSQQENAGRAIEAVRKPKRVIREKGRIVGIE